MPVSPALGIPMQVDDVPAATHDVALNVVSNTAPVTVPNTGPVATPNTVSVTTPVTVPVTVPVTAPVTAPVTIPVAAPATAPDAAPVPVPNVVPNLHPATWPVETDLIFLSGTTRVMLTAQRPLLRCVIHDAFEKVRVYLMFSNAFPDAVTIESMTRDSLVAAAESRERSSIIHQRLLHDEGYVASMRRLVSHYYTFM